MVEERAPQYDWDRALVCLVFPFSLLVFFIVFFKVSFP